MVEIFYRMVSSNVLQATVFKVTSVVMVNATVMT